MARLIRRWWPLALGLLIQLLVNGLAARRGIEVLPDGPTLRLAEVTRSIATGEGLRLAKYAELEKELIALSAETRSDVWQDVYALGRDGSLLPKHPLIVVLLASAIYPFIGEWSFIVLQQLTLFAALFATVWLVVFLGQGEARSSDSAHERFVLRTVLLFWGLTQTIFYVRGWTYDILNAALVMGGLALTLRFAVVGSFVFGLSILVRPSNLLIGAAPAFLAWAEGRDRRFIVGTFFGVGMAVLLWCSLNHVMWGGPFTTAYHRTLRYVDGERLLVMHDVGLNLAELFASIGRKLFDLRVGLLTYNPVFLLLPFAVLGMRDHPRRRSLGVILGVICALLAFICSYEGWYGSLRGNRFLFPAVYCVVVLAAVWIGSLGARPRERVYEPNGAP